MALENVNYYFSTVYFQGDDLDLESFGKKKKKKKKERVGDLDADDKDDDENKENGKFFNVIASQSLLFVTDIEIRFNVFNN